MSAIPFPPAEASAPGLARRDAIALFGVRYLHGGGFRNPVVEVLGRDAEDPDHAADRIGFEREEDAVLHVRNRARSDAQHEIAKIEAFLSRRRVRLQLWVSRNWKRARDKNIGLLGTEAILAASRRELRAIVKDGFTPRVARLPERIRLPAVLPLDTPVHVVDIRGFPARPVRALTTRIVSRTIVNTPGSEHFDAVVRYALADLAGSFRFDTRDPTVRRLDGAPDGVEAFLDEADAVASFSSFAEHVASQLRASAAEWATRVPCTVDLADLAEEIERARSRAPDADASPAEAAGVVGPAPDEQPDPSLAAASGDVPPEPEEAPRPAPAPAEEAVPAQEHGPGEASSAQPEQPEPPGEGPPEPAPALPDPRPEASLSEAPAQLAIEPPAGPPDEVALPAARDEAVSPAPAARGFFGRLVAFVSGRRRENDTPVLADAPGIDVPEATPSPEEADEPAAPRRPDFPELAAFFADGARILRPGSVAVEDSLAEAALRWLRNHPDASVTTPEE